MILKYTIILTFTLINFSFAQPYQTWLEVYDGVSSNMSTSTDIAVDSIGNVYILGSHREGVSNTYIALIKYNSIGEILWVRYFNGPGVNDIPSELKIFNTRTIYITARSSAPASDADYLTIKYDSSGLQQWYRRYTSEGDHRDASYDMTIDSKENIYVTGESFNVATNNIDCLTIKYNKNGDEIWLRRYAISNAMGYSMTSDSSGNIFVTGRGNASYFTVKYDSSGVQQWASLYHGSSDNSPRDIGLDNFGNVFVAGVSLGDLYYWDYATVKYDSAGNEQWVRRYNGTANFMDQLNAMAVDNNGNVYVTGNGTETGRGYDYVTIKYDKDGNEEWIAKYHNGSNDISTTLVLDDLGNVYVSGRSDGSGSQFDFATVKYDSSGNQLWVARYNSAIPHDDEVRRMVIDPYQNVYVTGTSSIWGQQHKDIITIKYSQSITGINVSNLSSPFDFSLHQNYPNPFNPKTVIKFDVANASDVSLRIFDALGKEVATLVNERLAPGSYSADFEAGSLPSGIYFYRIEADGFADTKRMMLIK